MPKVYPNACHPLPLPLPLKPELDSNISKKEETRSQVVLTVWRKSLLFNSDGFTVFDSNGNLVFRVDNYVSGPKGEIVLMSASGSSLLTIRHQKRLLSLTDKWVVYDGETSSNPRFFVRKSVNLLCKTTSSSILAQVISPVNDKVIYWIEGSYAQRCCTIYDDKRRKVAEIKRKEAARGGTLLGLDVFRLVILEPDQMDTNVAMALVVVLDHN